MVHVDFTRNTKQVLEKFICVTHPAQGSKYFQLIATFDIKICCLVGMLQLKIHKYLVEMCIRSI